MFVCCCSKILCEMEPPNWLLLQTGFEDSGLSLHQALTDFVLNKAEAAAAGDAAAAAADAAADADAPAPNADSAAAAPAAAAAESRMEVDGAAAAANPSAAAAPAAPAAAAAKQRSSCRRGESLLAGALSMALCCKQNSKPLNPQ